MEINTLRGQKIDNKISQNMSRILSNKIFKYKNISTEVMYYTSSHICIRFYEVSMSDYARPLCSIDILEEYYALTGSIAKKILYIYPKNLIVDRWKIYRWLTKTIKDYRRK